MATPVYWTTDRAKIETTVARMNEDEATQESGWRYELAEHGSYYAIAVYDEDGAFLGEI